MTSLEIVTHCLEYPKLLCFHLSGFVLYPPPDLVSLTLITADDDKPVRDVVKWFKHRLPFRLNDMALPREQVGRRSIGRNMAAKQTKADWVHFCDVDYVFSDGYFELFLRQLDAIPDNEILAFHRCVMGSTTLIKGDNTKPGSTAGDDLIASCSPPQIIDIDPFDFAEPMRAKKAIGGSQIARGDFCRKNGYCDGVPTAMKLSKKWLRTKEDVNFRVSCGGPGYPIDVPGIYRIRHSVHGGLNMPEGSSL